MLHQLFIGTCNGLHLHKQIGKERQAVCIVFVRIILFFNTLHEITFECNQSLSSKYLVVIIFITTIKHDELRSRAYRCYYILDFHTFCHCLVQSFLKFGLSYLMSSFLQTFLIVGLFILFLNFIYYSKTFFYFANTFLLF